MGHSSRNIAVMHSLISLSDEEKIHYVKAPLIVCHLVATWYNFM